MKQKVVAIIQSRMASTRLPGKVLLPLGPDNKSVLWWMATRAGLAELVDEVIIATTQAISNIPILDFCRKNGVTYYAYSGDENDLVGRVLTVGTWVNADIIIDLTADCPMIDPHHIDLLITLLKNSLPKFDYVSNDIIDRSWPDGLDIQVYWTKTLRTCQSLFNPSQHCGWNIAQKSKVFNIYHWQACKPMHWPELGLTLDTPEDYELLKIIFNKFGSDPGFHAETVVEYLRKNPELVEINKSIRRKVPEEG